MEEKADIHVPNMPASLEPDLVSRARSGDKAAFGSLVKLHQKRLLRMVLGMVGDVDAAMDIVQESFVKAYQALGSFETGRPFYPWLSTIATNLAINRIRQAGRNTGLEVILDTRADKSPDPSQELQLKENDRRFLAALKEMPSAYREVFVLRTYDELDYEQIASRLGISAGTVDSRLYRARRFLMEKLKDLL